MKQFVLTAVLVLSFLYVVANDCDNGSPPGAPTQNKSHTIVDTIYRHDTIIVMRDMIMHISLRIPVELKRSNDSILSIVENPQSSVLRDTVYYPVKYLLVEYVIPTPDSNKSNKFFLPIIENPKFPVLRDTVHDSKKK